MYILTLEQIKALPTVPERVTQLAIENEKLKTHTGELAALNCELTETVTQIGSALRPLVNELYERDLGVVNLNELVSITVENLQAFKANKEQPIDTELRKTHFNFVTSLMLLLKLKPTNSTQDLENIFREVKSLRDKVQAFEQIQTLTKGIYASQNAETARV